VTDGAGRRFRLVLTTQAQRAEQYRKQAAAAKQPPIPDVLPATEYGADDGVRLAEVWLTRDPEYPDDLPAQPLARYAYSPRGELVTVYDHSNTAVRALLMTKNTRAEWWRTIMRAGRNTLSLRCYRTSRGAA
jgi:hypothetical protein